MPGRAWRHFWRQFSKIWRLGDIFSKKMNALEILSPEPVTLIGSDIFQDVSDQLTKL